MAEFFTGSMCLDDVLSALKAGHSAFSKSSKNGKVYFSIKEWLNDEPDQYGNHMSILLNSEKDAPAAERDKKFYLGNLKRQKTGGESIAPQQGATIAAAVDTSNVKTKDAAAGAAAVSNGGGGSFEPIGGAKDGLPF